MWAELWILKRCLELVLSTISMAASETLVHKFATCITMSYVVS